MSEAAIPDCPCLPLARLSLILDLPRCVCAVSGRNQQSTALLIARGGDIEAVDTYGFRPLHRMASNNLAVGARALIEAGADVSARAGGRETPLQIALMSRALEVARVLKEAGAS